MESRVLRVEAGRKTNGKHSYKDAAKFYGAVMGDNYKTVYRGKAMNATLNKKEGYSLWDYLVIKRADGTIVTSKRKGGNYDVGEYDIYGTKDFTMEKDLNGNYF